MLENLRNVFFAPCLEVNKWHLRFFLLLGIIFTFIPIYFYSHQFNCNMVERILLMLSFVFGFRILGNILKTFYHTAKV